MRSLRLALIILAVGLTGPVSAKMMGPGMGSGPDMGTRMPMCSQCRLGEPLHAMCRVDLGALGLSEDVARALEDKRFELRKTVIRKRAELAVQRLELARMTGNKDFDLKGAQASAEAMADLEGEIESAHLAFLHDVATRLTEAQWQKLRQAGKKAMMSGMGGAGMRRGMAHGQPGRRMPCGMMMPSGGSEEHAGHHGDSSDEAEEFFENE